MRCTSCNAELIPGSRFCSVCGSPVSVEAPKQPQEALCQSCGAALIPGGLFCNVCGTTVEGALSEAVPVEAAEITPPVVAQNPDPVVPVVPEAPAAPVIPAVPETPVIPEAPAVPETPVIPETPAVSEIPAIAEVPVFIPASPVVSAPPAAPVFVPAAPVSAPTAQQRSTPVKGKTLSDLKKPLLIVGCVLVGALVIFLLVHFLGSLFGGPLSSVGGAVQETLDSENLTFRIRMDDGRVTGKLAVDLKERDLTVDMVYEESDGDEHRLILYKGYSIEGYDGYWSCHDVSDRLDMLFGYYEQLSDLENLDLEQLLEEMDILDEVEDYVDLKKLEKCLNAYLKSLNDKGWLEENAGYTSEKDDGETLHVFEPDLYDFLSASLEAFEDAFDDSDDYDDLKDSLKENKSYIRQQQFELTVGVKGDVLSSLKIEMEGEKYKVTFTDVGSTELDLEELDSILEEAQANEWG